MPIRALSTFCKAFPVLILLVCAGVSAQSLPSVVDTTPPVLIVNYPPGKYNSLLSIKITASEPATIYYTLDGSEPSERSMEYRGLLSITDEGRTTLRAVAYDLIGNRSKEYESVYSIDSRPPKADVSPMPGAYSGDVNVKIALNEPGRITYSVNRGPMLEYRDSLRITRTCTLMVTAVDETGNRMEPVTVVYDIDRNIPVVTADHAGGVFDKPFLLSLSSGPGIRIYYSFDEFAPLISYRKYDGPIGLKHGQTIVSFYGENDRGIRSDVVKKIYVIDVTAPKVNVLMRDDKGDRFLVLRANEKAEMAYTLDGSLPSLRSTPYVQPIPVPRTGILTLRVYARDQAGNESDKFERKFSYDVSPPVVTLDPPPGLYKSPIKIMMISSKPGRIYYTLDNSLPDKGSNIYIAPIALTRDSRLILTYYAIDELGNQSDYASVVYNLDQTPPKITPRIEKTKDGGAYQISFELDKGDVLYYTIGGGVPGILSTQYTAPFEIKAGLVVRYIASDSAGNSTGVQDIADLALPKVSANPPGGTYRKVMRVALQANLPGRILYRLKSKSLNMDEFQDYTEPLLFNSNGLYKVEYCSEDRQGGRSSITEESYLIDLFPPEINVYTQRNPVDSTVTLYFQASENATIYFTLDGTNPITSPTASLIGNKYFLSKDKLKLKQTQNLKINFIGEDVAGNRSEMYMFDVNLPTVVASPPEGAYHEVLHVALTTFNDAAIYYTTDGLDPTEHSSAYRMPIPVTKTTVLKYFAVDQYGFRGLVKGGTYAIDLPPRPDFTVDNDPVMEGVELVFNASGSVDEESPSGMLQYRWNFESDTAWDTDFGKDPKARMIYKSPGIRNVTLQVRDTAGLVSTLTRKIRVIKDCPRDMVPLFEGERAFCIDRFEYPNLRDSVPLTEVTWVEAVMKCRGAGKDLCKLSEWQAACRGRNSLDFPYGPAYDGRKCNTQGRGVMPAGDWRDCTGPEGVYDLTGNAWEWVLDRRDGYNLIVGGDFSYGKNARCDASFSNLISNREKSTGFRCCR